MHSDPIRPKLSLSHLLWGALILFLSLHDHFGGTPAIRGVLAAPAKRNRDQLPAQPETAQQVDPNYFVHTGVTLAELELRPTQSADRNQPFEIILYLVNRKLSPSKPAAPKDKWALQGGNYFAINLPHTDISATAAMLAAGGQTRKPKRVSSVKWGPGLRGTDKVSSNPGIAVGMITYASESTAKTQTIEFLHTINDAKPATNLLYLFHAVSEAKKAGLEIEMNDDWYYLVAGMLHVKGSGSGDAISETDAELQKVYSDLLANIIRERSADDPRLLEFKPKQ
ncbi:hypothetical protein C8R42DRAFT_663112 [Lentinula raphanica]|nr:hypothetical protein C8R42DRAFT_663112 [Lentinula raphanica]